MRTLKDLAAEALQIQNAPNLSGLVHGWSRVVTELRDNLPDASTDELNHHPINQLWADKLADLAGVGGALSDCGRHTETYGEAYRWCREAARSLDVGAPHDSGMRVQISDLKPARHSRPLSEARIHQIQADQKLLDSTIIVNSDWEIRDGSHVVEARKRSGLADVSVVFDDGEPDLSIDVQSPKSSGDIPF